MNRLSWTPHTYDLVVNCNYQPPADRASWAIRLTEGSKGMLMIKLTSSDPERTLCVGNTNDKKVVNALCAAAGYNYRLRAPQFDAEGKTAPAPFMGSVSVIQAQHVSINYPVCRDWEGETIRDCYFTALAPTCSVSTALTLNCDPGSISYRTFEFRLNTMGQADSVSGRVEFRPNVLSPWGAIDMSLLEKRTASTREALEEWGKHVASLACGAVGILSPAASLFFMPISADVASSVPVYSDRLDLLSMQTCPVGASSLVGCLKHLSSALTSRGGHVSSLVRNFCAASNPKYLYSACVALVRPAAWHIAS